MDTQQESLGLLLQHRLPLLAQFSQLRRTTKILPNSTHETWFHEGDGVGVVGWFLVVSRTVQEVQVQVKLTEKLE